MHTVILVENPELAPTSDKTQQLDAIIFRHRKTEQIKSKKQKLPIFHIWGSLLAHSIIRPKLKAVSVLSKHVSHPDSQRWFQAHPEKVYLGRGPDSSYN